ncbi:hypothetical protein AVEN_108018-1 [Araneus ventricosus]|uniref:Uncharacterized protein n=1 Tax=Araneus ventricosus TaxID=182803 RepID=A0A4Y2DS27_ARAVE|nr:hypothetical protein AVEN_108018-1 [Araneus ventricosus]
MNDKQVSIIQLHWSFNINAVIAVNVIIRFILSKASVPEPRRYAKEEYEEWISIDEDIPVAATLTDLEICQAVCEQDQALKIDNSDGDECVEENPPTDAEMRQALDILKRGV